ncbi:MAG: hypothetical protein ABR582_14365 [Gemmatimonadaceae bacterium]
MAKKQMSGCSANRHSAVRVQSALWRAGLSAFLLGVTTSCYVYPPVVSDPVPGTELRLDLNDRGRVGLGALAGTSAERVEGVLQSNTDTAYALKVTSVTYLNGQINKWSGEPLTVSKGFVASTSQKRFSSSRTLLSVAAAAAGVAAFIVTRNLLGSGTPETPDPGGGGGGSSFRLIVH